MHVLLPTLHFWIDIGHYKHRALLAEFNLAFGWLIHQTTKFNSPTSFPAIQYGVGSMSVAKNGLFVIVHPCNRQFHPPYQHFALSKLFHNVYRGSMLNAGDLIDKASSLLYLLFGRLT